MPRQPPSNWTLFYIMTTGLVLLMVSARPELQRKPGEDSAPATVIAVTGHVLSWTPGAVLVYRMVRSALQQGREDRPSSKPEDQSDGQA